MSRDLILWRHADADAGATEDDLSRTLSAKGEKQAQRVAVALNELLPVKVRIFASQAIRSQATSQWLGRTLKTGAELNPNASLNEVTRFICDEINGGDGLFSRRDRPPLLIVGHQPWMGMLATQILTGRASELSIRKASAWWFRRKETPEGEQTTLLTVLDPQFLSRI